MESKPPLISTPSDGAGEKGKDENADGALTDEEQVRSRANSRAK